MKATLATLVLVGLLVSVARSDERPTLPPPQPITDAPENDWRLAALSGASPQRIGILTYYPNNGGGYTFKDGQHIVFYALPFPSTKSAEVTITVLEKNSAGFTDTAFVRTLSTIGIPRMRFGCLTVFRAEMMQTPDYEPLREDIPIARWTRDTPTGKFLLSIMDVDSETRLKLKSIVPVLEHASKP